MRASVSVILVVLSLSGGSSNHTRGDEAAVFGGTLTETQLVRAALKRFQDAGLTLPHLEIRIHGDPADCHGKSGTFTTSTSPWLVTLCRVEEWVVLHELGHAWVTENLTEWDRNRYVEAQGLDSWAGAETPWRDRGSEQAADAIAWGMLDDPLGCYSARGSIATKVAAFRQLVNTDAPRLACNRGG